MGGRVTEWNAQAIAEEAQRDAAHDHAPLDRGSYVAWAVCQLGRTSGFSRVHRVGEPMGGEEMTTCGDVIPPPVLRVVLTPGLVRALGRCTHCEMLHARHAAVA